MIAGDHTEEVLLRVPVWTFFLRHMLDKVRTLRGICSTLVSYTQPCSIGALRFPQLLWFVVFFRRSTKLPAAIARLWKWKSCRSWKFLHTHENERDLKYLFSPNSKLPISHTQEKAQRRCALKNKTKPETLKGASATQVLSFHSGFQALSGSEEPLRNRLKM